MVKKNSRQTTITSINGFHSSIVLLFTPSERRWRPGAVCQANRGTKTLNTHNLDDVILVGYFWSLFALILLF